jgi:hypothetical protein
MCSVPIDPVHESSALEELLDRIRDGLRAEQELIARYAEIFGRDDSTPLRVLKAIYRSQADEAGTDIVSVVGMLLAERGKEIGEALEDYSTPESFETRVGQRVQREIWKLRKRYRRGPSSGDPRVEEVQTKGYQPGSIGDPNSTILFQTVDERLESAIRRTRGKTEAERKLNEILARLHVLKGWGYDKLARLVFGPGLEADELQKAGDRIRKWIQEPIRHVRAEKKRNEEKRKTSRRDAPNGAGKYRPVNDEDLPGDDRV